MPYYVAVHQNDGERLDPETATICRRR